MKRVIVVCKPNVELLRKSVRHAETQSSVALPKAGGSWPLMPVLARSDFRERSPEPVEWDFGLLPDRKASCFCPCYIPEKRLKCNSTEPNNGQLNAHHTIAAARASAATIIMNALTLFIRFSLRHPPNRFISPRHAVRRACRPIH